MVEPLLMTMSGTLLFTKSGQWIHDGVPVTHEGIALYFSTHIKYAPAFQSFVIEDDGRCVKVEVEDTPRVVRSIQTQETPWQLLLNNQASELFLPERLLYKATGELYYELSSEPYFARLLSPAIQGVLPAIAEQGGEYYFEQGSISVKLRPYNEPTTPKPDI